MKKFIALLFVLVSFQMVYAQTNAFSTWKDENLKNSRGEVVAKKITAAFTMDSLGVVLLSKPIDLQDFLGVDFNVTPAEFRFKTVSTYDSSNTQIRLLACYQSTTDTVFAIDTLRAFGLTGVTATQIETDSTGTLTFNSRMVPQVRVAIQCLRSDVNTGVLDLLFRKTQD